MGFLENFLKRKGITSANLRLANGDRPIIAGKGEIVFDGERFKRKVYLGSRVGDGNEGCANEHCELGDYNSLEVDDATLVDRLVSVEFPRLVQVLEHEETHNAVLQAVYFGDSSENIGLRVFKTELKDPGGYIIRGYGCPIIIDYNHLNELFDLDNLLVERDKLEEERLNNSKRFMTAIDGGERETALASYVDMTTSVGAHLHAIGYGALPLIIIGIATAGAVIRNLDALRCLRMDPSEQIEKLDARIDTFPVLEGLANDVAIKYLRKTYSDLLLH